MEYHHHHRQPQATTFEKEIVQSQRPHIRRQLESPGTYLDDIAVLQLFYHMAVGKRYTRDQVCLVDCCLLQAALYSRDDQREKNQGHLRQQFREAVGGATPIILMPLVGLDHWSLLCYRTRAQRWYHLDSLAPLHSKLGRSTVTSLKRLGITDGQLESLDVPRQFGGWECGLYALQYMLQALECTRLVGIGNEERFKRKLLRYSKLACDENLLLFTRSLLAVI